MEEEKVKEVENVNFNNNEVKNGTDKKKNLIITFVIIAVATLAFIGGMILLNGESLNNSADELLNRKLVELTNELNKTTPYMIDKNTRLDNSIVKPGKTISYNYSVIGYSEEELKATFTAEVIEYQKGLLVNSVKTLPELQFFRDNEINLEYVYKTESGAHLATIKIPYSLYK